MVPVYGSMLRAICLWYHVLPELRTLRVSEIAWWYDGIRGVLMRETAPSPSPS
jgi:hypothetical protein